MPTSKPALVSGRDVRRDLLPTWACCMCCNVTFSIKQQLLLINCILVDNLHHFFGW